MDFRVLAIIREEDCDDVMLRGVCHAALRCAVTDV